MPTTPKDQQHTGSEKQAHQERGAAIGRRVMNALGRPLALHWVRVRPLWEDHYRVNILIGEDAASARIAHSFFLVADEDGTIRAATPAIARQYDPATGNGE
jgi:hypothetical protein